MPNATKMADEKVVCVHLGDEGKNTFLGILGSCFTENKDHAWFGKKEDLFQEVCKRSDYEEICGRLVFLNPEELQELISEDTSDTQAA